MFCLINYLIFICLQGKEYEEKKVFYRNTFYYAVHVVFVIVVLIENGIKLKSIGFHEYKKDIFCIIDLICVIVSHGILI